MEEERIRVDKQTDGRLLVDMDGTLAKFNQVDTLEILYEEGYFRSLEPLRNVIDAIKEIIRTHPDKQVYVMSSVLSDSRYALQEKNEWLDKYLPEIDMQHRIFPPCGDNKLDYVPGGIRQTDCLLDDYTHNLVLWEPPAKGIKLLNGINHTHETWKGNMLRYDKSPSELAENIVDILDGKRMIQDERPLTKMAWRTDETGSLKAEYFDMAQKIGLYEEKVTISQEERVTNWFGDMACYEIRDDVTEEMFRDAYAKATILLDMDALGYEPTAVSGHSDYFLMWKAKEETGTENAFGFDGWDMVKHFVGNVHTLMNYTAEELQNRINGDYSVIPYGYFDEFEIQAAMKNHPQKTMERSHEMKQKNEAPFGVYLENLAVYTAGGTKGRWISLPQEDNELRRIIKSIAPNGEELMIMDTDVREECAYMRDVIGEWDNIYELNTIARLVGNEPHPSVQAYIESNGNLSLQEIANLFMQEDEIPYFPYEFEGMENPEVWENLSPEAKMGYTVLEHTPGVEQIENMQINDTSLLEYINIEAIGRDMSLNGTMLKENGYFNTLAEGPDLKAYTMDEIREELAEKEKAVHPVQKERQRTPELSPSL